MLTDNQLRERAAWLGLSAEQKTTLLKTLTPEGLLAIKHSWHLFARNKQIAIDNNCQITLLLAGRGFGKSRCLVEYALNEIKLGRRKEIMLVGETPGKVIQTFVKGPNGFLALAHPNMKAELVGSIIYFRGVPGEPRIVIYSGANPERIRGMNAQLCLVDEWTAFDLPEDTLDQCRLSTRIDGEHGELPKIVIATTPKPKRCLRELMKEAGIQVIRGSTFENKALPTQWVEQLKIVYGDSRKGRQELLGEVLDNLEQAAFNTSLLDSSRVIQEGLVSNRVGRFILGVDPSFEGECETGIVKIWLADNTAFVIADYSMPGSVEEWTNRIAQLCDNNTTVVYETNAGGAAVKTLIQKALQATGTTVPLIGVHNQKNKLYRAELSAQYMRLGRLKLAGKFPELEDQMVTFSGDESTSPDRLDALTIAVNHFLTAELPVIPDRDAFQLHVKERHTNNPFYTRKRA